MEQKTRGFWASSIFLFKEAFSTVRNGGSRLVGAIFVMQLFIILVMFPVIRWLFHEALRASGLVGVDLSRLTIGTGFILTGSLIAVIVLLAFWLLAIQLTIVSVLTNRARLGLPLTFKQAINDLKPVLKKVFKPSALPMIFYLFLVLPITGFGFLSALVQGISVPPFVSGELYKSTSGTVIMSLFIIAMLVLNILWALTIPIFTLTEATGGKALRLSTKMMFSRGFFQIPLLVITVFIIGGVITALLIVFTIFPVSLSDLIEPESSAVVGAITLGIAQTLSAFLTASIVAFIVSILLAFLKTENVTVTVSHKNESRQTNTILITAGIVIATFLAFANFAPLNALDQKPETLVLGHRGISGAGVENTISSLEAAAVAGADLVEIDVMQTKDKKFVVMHDTDLERLAGVKEKTQNLTFQELTELTVTDKFGHEDKIPSLEEYILRAKQLTMPLLIEIKLGGQETADHVDLLIAELENLEALNENIYHTLDPQSVERLKTLRPDLTVGYTMPLAGVAVPETSADFIVVEEWTASEKMQREADLAGLGFMVWTVNETESIREFLRRGPDGIITDHPDVAYGEREQMKTETGLAGVMWDALDRFVTVF